MNDDTMQSFLEVQFESKHLRESEKKLSFCKNF